METNYIVEIKENRATVYRNGEWFIELDNTHGLKAKDFLVSHRELFDALANDEYSDYELDVILGSYNASFKGKNFKKGQLSIFDY